MADEDVREVRLRGDGGTVTTFSLPLSEIFADQVAKGALVPDDDESAALLADVSAPVKDALGDDDNPPGAEEPPANGEPPRGGPGSGRDEWAAYAATLDVEVTEDMARDDIIAAVDALTE